MRAPRWWNAFLEAAMVDAKNGHKAPEMLRRLGRVRWQCDVPWVCVATNVDESKDLYAEVRTWDEIVDGGSAS